jgi:hypothetical protein
MGLAWFQEAAEKLCAYFKSLGADFVFDLKFAEDLSLIEQEYILWISISAKVSS